jgi:hypothetical protein
MQRAIQAEAHDRVTAAAASFLTALGETNAGDLLGFITTPESLPAWRDQLSEVQETLRGRGMATLAEYPAPDIPYVKLPPDPGENVRATGDVALPADTVILTLQRRPELIDVVDLGHWRVHAVGNQGALPEDMPSHY